MQRHLSTGPSLIAALLAHHRNGKEPATCDHAEVFRDFLGFMAEEVGDARKERGLLNSRTDR